MFIFTCFPFNCETMHIARHLNNPMSTVFDTLVPGRSCLCLALPLTFLWQATKGATRQLGEYSPALLLRALPAAERGREKPGQASQFRPVHLCASSSRFRANYVLLCLPTFAFCDREDGVEANGRAKVSQVHCCFKKNLSQQ